MLRGLLLFAIVQLAGAADPNGVLLHPDDEFWKLRAPGVFQVVVTTTQGVFTIEARRESAPLGADRLYNLARAGFFDNSRFHRVAPGFVAQFGIPGDPAVAAVWRDRRIPADPERGSNTRGTVGFAMITPDARTTQLYINLADNLRNDYQGFAVFGRVVAGMEVVDRLYSGYGENSGGGMRAGRQAPLFEGGNAYLDAAFPKLDRLITAKIR